MTTTTATRTRRTPTQQSTEQRRARQDELLAALADGVLELTTSDGWRRYLRAMATLRTYSSGNSRISQTREYACYRQSSGLGQQMSRLETATCDGKRGRDHDQSRDHAPQHRCPQEGTYRSNRHKSETCQVEHRRDHPQPWIGQARRVGVIHAEQSFQGHRQPTRNHQRLDSSRMMLERANRRNPALVRCRQARTAFARPSSATCSKAMRSTSFASSTAVVVVVVVVV